MKILFILHSYYKYNKGGAELQIKYISEYLNEKGFDIHYLFLHKEQIETIDNYTHLYSVVKKPLAEKLFGKICYYTKVSEKLKQIKPDIIYHRNLSSFALPVVNYCKDNNCKSFLHLAHIQDVEDNFVFNKRFIANLLDKYGKKQVLLKFHKVIAQAQYQDTLLQENFNRKADLILANMHPYPKEKISKTEKVRVLWIANFKGWKQPEKFIELAHACRNINAEFIMIGRDSNDDKSKILKEKIAKLENLIYLGELPIDEVNQYLASSHVFVDTSLHEGFPNTFIQAWMREVPVVSLHVNPDDVLIQNQIGFFSETSTQLVEDVKNLIVDKELRMRMGKKSKEYSFKYYSLKNIDNIIKLIQER